MFDLLGNDTTLITATTRLSREIGKAYSQKQRQKGLISWETPDILPCSSWFERTWKRLRTDSGSDQSGLDLLLNYSQSRQIWKKIIRRDIRSNGGDDEHLWNINATVRSAMDTWRICLQWDIDFNDFGDYCLTDHRSFSRWAREFQSHCRQRHWLDPHQLPDDIVTRIEQGIQPVLPHLIWVGFGSLRPDQKRLIECLRASGITVSVSKPDGQPASGMRYLEFDSERDQWLAAAQWAKDTLTCNPEYRIAIVAPDLVRSRQALELEFTRTLCPISIINPDKSHDRPFHIALGKQLNVTPVVRSAINLLTLFTEKPVNYEAIACMLIDPFIRGATWEMAQRHQLEYRYRQEFAYEIKVFVAWNRITENSSNGDSADSTPELVQIFSRLRSRLPQSKQTLPFSEWARLFTEWLDGFGWPGDETLDSAEHQVVQAFRREILNLATLDLIESRSTIAEALSVLTERLTTQPFEPESAQVNIEIMGILESAGIEFDAVWFGNLNEKEWPPRLNKSPFIPATLQSEAGYFKSDFDLNYTQAGDLQQQLTSQCREIVFSRARFEEDVEQPPSPLVAWPTGSSGATQTEPSLLHHYQQHKPLMEVFEDCVGAPVTNPDVRGGASIIENQSACPFRSYAIHRLNARDNEYRQPGLDAVDRGSLVHKVLEKLWTRIKTSERLRAMEQTERMRLIGQAIYDCSRSGFNKSGLGRGFFEIQTRWLKNLMLQWFEEELSRNQDFQVEETEKPYILELGGLELSFRVDRIDRLADGSCVVIDYKTGETSSIAAWIGERPKHPQLPLYALAIIRDSANNDMIACMTYGQVRHAECGYQGVSIKHQFKDKTPASRVVPLEEARIDQELRNWPILLSHWNTHLEQLAQSFSDGHAKVNPRDSMVCQYCNLTGLCRRHEFDAKSDHETNLTA